MRFVLLHKGEQCKKSHLSNPWNVCCLDFFSPEKKEKSPFGSEYNGYFGLVDSAILQFLNIYFFKSQSDFILGPQSTWGQTLRHLLKPVPVTACPAFLHTLLICFTNTKLLQYYLCVYITCAQGVTNGSAVLVACNCSQSHELVNGC